MPTTSTSKTGVSFKANTSNVGNRAYNRWHVVLLVDCHERCHSSTRSMPRDELVEHINRHFNKCHRDNDCGSSERIPHCETRSLLAGDYVWVARRRKISDKSSSGSSSSSSSKKNDEEYEIEERLLDCVIERKSFADLHTSLTTQSTRFYPLSRMQIQLHKLKASTLSDTWLLLEREPSIKPSQQGWSGPSSAVRQLGSQFRRDIQQGREYPGIVWKETQNVTDTVQFLIDQHERMCRRVELAEQQEQQATHQNKIEIICIDDDDDGEDKIAYKREGTKNQKHRTVGIPTGAAAAATTTTRAPPSSPFATIGTIEKMNHNIRATLGDSDDGSSTFLYYVRLRRVDRMGDNKARAIMARFPTENDLRMCCSGGTIVEAQPQRQKPKQKQQQSLFVTELIKLPLIGRVLALRVQEAFVSAVLSTASLQGITLMGSDKNSNQETTATATSLVSVVTPPPKLKPPEITRRAIISTALPVASSKRKRSSLSDSCQRTSSLQAGRRTIPASFFEDSDSSDEDEFVQRVTSMISKGSCSKRPKRQHVHDVQQSRDRFAAASCPIDTKDPQSVARRQLAFPSVSDTLSETKRLKKPPPPPSNEIIEID